VLLVGMTLLMFLLSPGNLPSQRHCRVSECAFREGKLRDMATDAASENTTPIAVVTTEQLAKALRTVIADGLPCEEDAAGLLLQLRSVYARSVVPSDLRSRLQALNELLPRLIAGLDDARYREATQILFGLAPGTRRTSLTSRRRQAATRLDYSAPHFRTDIEADVVHAVAVAVHDDLLRYQSRVKRASESLEPTGDTPSLGPEHINAEEELVSRIWQHVYGLRAELIATLRLSTSEGLQAQAEDHRQAALREERELQQLLGEYTETYGESLIRHGESEFTTAAIERLARWRG
jgi:hypothetical protein